VTSFCSKAVASCPELLQEAFIEQSKLHLTICMLAIPSKRDMARTVSLLKDCIWNKMDIVLKGIAIMKGTEDCCNVLYAKVEPSSQLMDLGREIILKLAANGLIFDYRPIKWHDDIVLICDVDSMLVK
jgi:hypothetical protein